VVVVAVLQMLMQEKAEVEQAEWVEALMLQ
jgi:hypothetical protein